MLPTKTPTQGWEKPIEQSLQPPNTQSIKKWSYGLIGAGALSTLATALLYRKGLYPLLGKVTLIAAPTALLTGFSLTKRADKQQEQWRKRTQDILSPNGQSLKQIRERAPHASPEQLAFAIREDLLSENFKYSDIIETHSALELSKLFEEECNPHYREALKAKFLKELKETASLKPLSTYNATGQLLSSFPNLKVTTDEYLTAFKSGLSEEEKEVGDDNCFYDTAEQAIAKHHWDSLFYLISTDKAQFEATIFLQAAEKGDTLSLEYLFNNPPISFRPNWPRLLNQCLNTCPSYHLPTIEMLIRQVECDGCAIIESRTTPDLLHKVAASKDSEASGLITKLLNYAYVDPNASHDNKRPLWAAIQAENALSIEALVTHPTHPADPNFTHTDSGYPAFTPLQKAVERDSKAMVVALLKAKNLQDKEGAFIEAVKGGKCEAASAFLEDKTFTPPDSALPTAIMQGAQNQKMVDILWKSSRVNRGILHNGQSMQQLATTWNVALS